MQNRHETLRTLLLRHTPTPQPLRYFIVWSILVTLLAFFMKTFVGAVPTAESHQQGADGAGTAGLLDFLASFLLTLFVIMLARMPEINSYETFSSFLDGLSGLPSVIRAYVDEELRDRRIVAYFCLINGIVAGGGYAAVNVATLPQSVEPFLTAGMLFFVAASLLTFGANHVRLRTFQQYLASLHDIEFLNEEVPHAAHK